MKQYMRWKILRGKLRAVKRRMLMDKGTSDKTMCEMQDFERQTENGHMAVANGQGYE